MDEERAFIDGKRLGEPLAAISIQNLAWLPAIRTNDSFAGETWCKFQVKLHNRNYGYGSARLLKLNMRTNIAMTA